jgi:serine phosphatase RsbU (regulator of sigma subunit)/pSer/pThr/pTyr-binding forkhead associated (FHA) protein
VITKVEAPARLIVSEGEQKRVVLLDRVPFTLGRLPGSDLHLEQAQVSREHAVIDYDGDHYVITDRGSRHGTFVNGMRADKTTLRTGDQIQLGATAVMLLFQAEASQTTARSLIEKVTSAGVGSELEKLSLFLQAAQSLNGTRVLSDVLNTLVEYALRLTGAERGFVFLGDTPADFVLACGRSREGLPLSDGSKISNSIVRDAVTSGLAFVSGDVTGEGLALGRESVAVHELRSVIAIPLRSQTAGPQEAARLVGLLYLDSRTMTSHLNGVSKEILNAIATEAVTLLENVRMVEAEHAAMLVRKELEIASGIQHRLIACELPHFDFARLAAKTVPCLEVGGDFYDVIPARDGFVAILADVSGKGMSAALLASIIQGMMYAMVAGGSGVVDAVTAVNSFLRARVSGEKYATMVALHMSEAGQVELVNAGHVPPVVWTPADGARIIEDGDVPVGLLPDAVFHSIRFTMEPGARLLLLSDGVTEAENPEGEEFGVDGAAAQMGAPRASDAVLAALVAHCRGVKAADDRTVLSIERTA